MTYAEGKAIQEQENAVAEAKRAGKDKRDIRKLKNRLSALRSRHRKDADVAAMEEVISSLQMQLSACTQTIAHLCHKDSELNTELRIAAPPALQAAGRTQVPPVASGLPLLEEKTNDPSAAMDLDNTNITMPKQTLTDATPGALSSTVGESAAFAPDTECGTPMISETRALHPHALRNLNRLLLGQVPEQEEKLARTSNEQQSKKISSSFSVSSAPQATVAPRTALTIWTLLISILNSLPGTMSSTPWQTSLKTSGPHVPRSNTIPRPPKTRNRVRLRRKGVRGKRRPARLLQSSVRPAQMLHRISLRRLLSPESLRRLRAIARSDPLKAR